jgi:hypothetical protein
MDHVDRLIDALKARGFTFSEHRRVDGHQFTFAIFTDVTVQAGPHAGKILQRLAIPIPDDSMLPPPGIHTIPQLAVIGQKNVHASPLGPEWAYWSRPIAGFRPEQGVARIVSHILSIFRDA